jgi:plasmid stability protein
MASILLENVPESIHRALKERAEINNRSLGAEAFVCPKIARRSESSARRKTDRMPSTLSNDSLWDACHPLPK